MHVWNGTKKPPPRRWGLLRRPLVALVALAAVGVLAAGCGSNGSGSSSGGRGAGYGSSGTAPASGGASSVATVSATSTSLGTILVDGSGRTLYLFREGPAQPVGLRRRLCGGVAGGASPAARPRRAAA